MRETLDEFQGGLQKYKLEDEWSQTYYADDIVLLATSEAKLQKLVD